MPLLYKSKISSFGAFSMTVQAGFCRTWSEPKLLVFSCTGSCVVYILVVKMKIFTGNFLIFFLIFAQNIDCGYTSTF